MYSRHSRLPGELLFLVLALLLSGFLLWAAWDIAGFESITSAGAFPLACAGLMLLTGLVNLLRALRSRPMAAPAVPLTAAPGADGQAGSTGSAAAPASTITAPDMQPVEGSVAGMPAPLPAGAAPRPQVLPGALLKLLACMLGYLLLLEPLGFVVASLLFLLVSMSVLGSRRIGLNLLVAVGVVGLIFVLFRTVFSVVLPAGTLVAPWLPAWLH